MIGIKRLAGRATAVTAVTAAATMAFSGLAFADNINDSIEDSGAGLTMEASSTSSAVGKIKLVSTGGDNDAQCNIDAGDNPLKLEINTPTGVTASPNPLLVTQCDVFYDVTFTASKTAVSGAVTATILSPLPQGGGTYNNNVHIPITITQPAVTNTAPEVSVTGVANGATYEKSKVPQPGCSVTDAEDTDESATPQIAGGAAYNDLGSRTVTCSYTDKGTPALTGSDSKSYTVVRDKDTTAPVITKTVTGTQGSNDWYTSNVTLDWTVTENESPETLILDGCDDVTVSADQAATDYSCSATSEGGTAAKQTVSIKRDATKPTNIAITGGPTAGGSYYFGDVPAAPEKCTADDATSGVAICDVTGYSTAVGTHTMTAKATDNAGNSDSITSTYTVKAWTLSGFYQPVDMGIWNSVKGGSTVPLKFEAFAGDNRTNELTSTSAVKSFTQKTVACPGATATVDEIELVTTGGTSLRYDSTGGQFVQNWQTPKKPGTCAQVTMTTQDGSTLSANFMLK